MAGFDKNRCLENIYSLAKEKGVKIGELESGSGVSVGYLSRLGKEDNTSVPSVETMDKMAEILDVTVDYLLRAEEEGLPMRERTAFRFADKLIKDTLDDKVNWVSESARYYADHEKDGDFGHPLFHQEATPYYDEENDEHCFIYKNDFHSRFAGKDAVVLKDDSFYASLPGSYDRVYLMSVARDIDGIGIYSKELEIYLVPAGKEAQPFISTNAVSDELGEKVKELYELAAGRGKGVMINDEVESVVSRYLR